MGCAGLLTPELDCPSTWPDRGLLADTIAVLASPTVDQDRDWEEPILDSRDGKGTSLLAGIAALLRRRSRAD